MPTPGNPAGAPPLDWWAIPTHPYPGSHYATYPPDLCERPIKSMCPMRVCTVCGEPSRRLTDVRYDGGQRGFTSDNGTGRGGHQGIPTARKIVETTGWTDCGCSTDGSHWRNGVVLDPFAGSGTTLAVATGHGRDAIGIDLDPRNFDLARERVGMFLEVAA
jgi:site-specific DNA-methyltransferase (adenine-specific)